MPLLKKTETLQARLGGRLLAVDHWLQSRRDLLVQFLQLTGDQQRLPEPPVIDRFCNTLVDYLSVGHFDIYQTLLQQVADATPDTEARARQLYPQLRRSTDLALAFVDRYAGRETELPAQQLDADLATLGVALAERFEWEDELLELLFNDEDAAA